MTITASEACVCIITFRRNSQLQWLLESLLLEQTREGFHVVVVDNDDCGSARDVVANSNCGASYVLEEKPGIAAARNAALSNLPSGCRTILFVDDDEVVAEGWFGAILGCLNERDADVVLGPVVSKLESTSPRWISKGGFIQRPRLLTGTTLKAAATNNVIIRLDALNKLQSPRFDEAFSATGGSDAELFWRMRRLGALMLWCDEAVVFERVPEERTTLSWVTRRLVRAGNVNGRLLRRTRPRAVVLLLGAGRVAYGALTTIGAILRGRGFREREFAHLAKGLGMIGACTGHLIVEYKRADAKPADSSVSNQSRM